MNRVPTYISWDEKYIYHVVLTVLNRVRWMWDCSTRLASITANICRLNSALFLFFQIIEDHRSSRGLCIPVIIIIIISVIFEDYFMKLIRLQQANHSALVNRAHSLGVYDVGQTQNTIT